MPILEKIEDIILTMSERRSNVIIIGDFDFLFMKKRRQGCIGGGKPSHEDELRQKLMADYNPVALPSPKTVVTVRFTILHFIMNEKMQSLDIDLWTSMEWKDPRLKWINDDYDNIVNLAFDNDKIWHPDLSLYNSADGKLVDVFAHTQMLAMPDGSVIWVPASHIKAACVMDMTYWPYDVHNCTAKFGSWIHSSQTVDFRLKDDDVEFEMVRLRSERMNLTRADWQVIQSSVTRKGSYYVCCPEEYVSISVILVLKRLAAPYAWIVQTPVVVLSLMTVAVFLLPPSAGEKVILGAITLALDFFFLFAVSNLIGHASSHTPLIVELISKQLVLTGASVIISGILLRLVRDPHATGLPVCLREVIVVLSSCLCLRGYRQMASATMIPISRSMKGEDLELNENGATGSLFPTDSKGGGGGEGEWVLLAATLDRICLIIFAIIFLINMTTYTYVL